MVKLSPTVANQITVSWAADYGRGYAMTVALVHKLSSADLLQRLHKKGAKHSDHTRALGNKCTAGLRTFKNEFHVLS